MAQLDFVTKNTIIKVKITSFAYVAKIDLVKQNPKD